VSTEIKVPSTGESVTEGTLSRWLKKDGAVVHVDEPVVELETEKATTEVAAPAAGKLRIDVPEGQTVSIGTVIGHIEEMAEADAAKSAPKTAAPSKPTQPAPPAPPEKEAAPQKTDMPLSPAARKMAEQANVQASDLKGTGRGGRIIKEDVAAYLDEHLEQIRAASEPSPATGSETRRPMSSIRRRIADRLVSSQQTTATLTTFNEVDLSAVITLRQEFKDRFREKHQVNLGFMSFFVKACVDGLRNYPIIHARIEGNDLVYPNAFHLGVAVSTDKGLMVPVLRDADRLTFAEVEGHIAEMAQKARDGKIAVTDLQGGSFTITNGGIFGSMLSTPILNPPQSAILGMHATQKRAVVVQDQVVIRPMMYLALSYDHRLIDGRDAVLFLVRVKECLENPQRMLLEV
jgi:2-oxoglutarate dehydrogenase E2 component (dihydrolipoamide succinyltransferase)